MKLTKETQVTVFRNTICAVVTLPKGQEVKHEYLHAEHVLVIANGTWQGWYFSVDRKWMQRNTE
jgi:hypothetical protein